MESEVGAVNRKTNYHDFVIFDSAEKSSVYDSFHELRFEVNEFLQNAVKNYQETQGEKLQLFAFVCVIGLAPAALFPVPGKHFLQRSNLISTDISLHPENVQ